MRYYVGTGLQDGLSKPGIHPFRIARSPGQDMNIPHPTRNKKRKSTATHSTVNIFYFDSGAHILCVYFVHSGSRGFTPTHPLHLLPTSWVTNPQPSANSSIAYTWCNRRNGPEFGRVFLRSYYTDITQNPYIQSSMVTEILAREV